MSSITLTRSGDERQLFGYVTNHGQEDHYLQIREPNVFAMSTVEAAIHRTPQSPHRGLRKYLTKARISMLKKACRLGPTHDDT